MSNRSKLSIKSMLWFFTVIASMTAGGCALVGRENSDKGELLQASSKSRWGMSTPKGMVFVPGGSFMMGPTEQSINIGSMQPSKRVTLSSFFMDETEITNKQYRQFIEALLDLVDENESAYGESPEDDLLASVVETEYKKEDTEEPPSEAFIMENLYPNMEVWREDFVHHMGDPMVEYYFEHSMFDNFPIVGVTWEAAKYFTVWRTEHLNEYREEKSLWKMPAFRLPTAAEREYATRGGKELVKYPWGGPYIRDGQGKVLANFKSDRGNYAECGYSYTSPVEEFAPNDYGLYDMVGNVAEWCLDTYNPAALARIWDVNPLYIDESQPYKIIQGGSWKDTSRFLQIGVNDYEHKDIARSYIGFRCVMPHIGEAH